MRQFSKKILLILMLFTVTSLPTFSAVKGGVEYSIPLDYSKVNEQEVEKKEADVDHLESQDS